LGGWFQEVDPDCGYSLSFRSPPIPLKKSKMPPQQSSRKSDLIADFGWRCPLRVCGKATEPFVADMARAGTPVDSACRN
jgi:hypothetical protein